MITEITVSVPRHLADAIVQARQVADPAKFDQSLLAGIDAARGVADWTAIDAHPGDRRSVRLPVSQETLELINHVNSFFALRSRARIVTAAVVAAQSTRNGNVFATLAKRLA